MINLKKNKNMLIIFGIILLFISFNQSGITEKKETNFGQLGMGVGLLVVGVGIFFVPGMQITGATVAIVGGLWALIGFSLFSGIASIFAKPTISPIVWIVGFLILAFMALKGKK